jgi:predicted transcriptional regulator
MKSVLISIHPKWCELIASGKKTVEVRKTRPKIEKPFKCYIYETQGKTETPWIDEEGHLIFKGRGQVIGEFVCDSMTSLKADNMIQAYYNNTRETCLTDEEIKQYANNGKLYYWHISELVIYDKPKELGEFYTLKKCDSCKSGYESTACIYDEDCRVPSPLKRPFQSWGYVEERSEK